MDVDIKCENRILWIDALRFLGIFAIYLGHYAEQAGKFYLFVFSYHVPLFFFVAGFFAVSTKTESIGEFITKKIRTLILPYYIFAVIFETAHAIHYNLSGMQILSDLLTYISATRDTLNSWSLWFFTCLFIVSVVYKVLYTLVKNKIILFVISFGIYLLVNIDKPSLFWNIDTAAVYLVYYAFGSLIFPSLNNLVTKQHFLKSKIGLVVMAVGSIAFAALVYFKGMYYIGSLIYPQHVLISKLFYFAATCVLIYANIQIARLISQVKLFQELGQETLVLCGVEFLTRLIIPSIIGIVGLTINLSTPLVTMLYSYGCLLFGHYVCVPVWNRYIAPVLSAGHHRNIGFKVINFSGQSKLFNARHYGNNSNQLEE